MKSSKKAFTLIELLVVIAIIGILATISVIALSNARAKSRDAKRIADTKQVSTALELFFNDNNRYPTDSEFNSGIISSSTVIYMQNIPTAPTPNDGTCTNDQNAFTYHQTEDGASYTISMCLGNNTGSLDAGPKCLTPGGVLDADCLSFTCGTDSVTYEGEVYPTVYIDNIGGHNLNLPGQCWFAKNLNIGTMVTGTATQANTGTIEKYCYNDDTANCTIDGGLYQWSEAMQYYSGAFDGNGNPTVNVQGICPAGWHVPSDLEQNTLDQYLTDTACDANRSGTWDCADAGTKLKSGGTSGFEGLLAGVRDHVGSFYYQGTFDFFWSSSLSGSDAWFHALGSSYTNVFRSPDPLVYGFSVRCLQD